MTYRDQMTRLKMSLRAAEPSQQVLVGTSINQSWSSVWVPKKVHAPKSKRSTPLHHLTTQTRRVSQLVLASSDLCSCRTLSPEQVSSPIGIHVHLQRSVICLSRGCEYIFCSWSVSASRFFHVPRETLHGFRSVNPFLRNVGQLHHHATIQCRFCQYQLCSEVSISIVCFSFPQTRGVSTLCAPTYLKPVNVSSISFASAASVIPSS